MNKKVIKILEFNKIVETLSSFAVSSEAAELCRNLRPINTPSEIERMQTETADALSLIFKKDVPSFSGVHDVSMHINKARIGGCLAAADLLQIASLLLVAKRCREYYNEEAREVIKEESPLDEMFTFLDPVKPLQERISKIILTEDEIADDASSTLFSIRKEKASTETKIRNLMNSYVADGGFSDLLQERVVTTRVGRFCLPVKAENKTKVPGMIHDQSATGSTLFIEPLEVVNLNNTLRELELQEKEETVIRQRFGMSTNKTSTLEEVGEYIGVPDQVIHKTPDDGLSGLSDEEKLGVNFKDLHPEINNNYSDSNVTLTLRNDCGDIKVNN